MKYIEFIPLFVTIFFVAFKIIQNSQENKKLALKARAINDRFDNACIKNFEILGYPREQAVLRHKWVQGRITDEEKEIHRKFCETFVEKADPFSVESIEKVEKIANDLGINQENKKIH